MKNIVILLGLIFLSSSAFAQISVAKTGSKKPAFASQWFEVKTPEDEKITFFITYTIAYKSLPRPETILLFGLDDDEKRKIDLTEAFYWKNGQPILRLGKGFQVVGKPFTDPRLDYLQSYVPPVR